jgi:hypothetical protein
LLDALDECDETRSLLGFLKLFPDNPDGSLHLLVTSRKEVIIEESLNNYIQISLEEGVIADDIRAFRIMVLIKLSDQKKDSASMICCSLPADMVTRKSLSFY